MLVNGSGIRAISRVLKVSTGCILRTLVKAGELLNIRPQKKHYHKVQINKLSSFVGNKDKKYGLSMLMMPKAMKYWR